MVRTGATLADAAAEWLRYSEQDRAVKKSTLTEYRLTADRLVRELGDVPIEDVTPEMLERWKATLKLSNRSVAKYLVILHGIFKRAMKVWGLPRNPVATVERPRYRVSDDLDAFSPEEVWALVRAAGSEQDAALFLTASFTGLRMGELVALQWRDVDFAGEAIRVRHSYNIHGGLATPKSGKVRSVPLVPDVAQALAGLGQRAASSPTIWCSRMSWAGSWTPARSGIATRPLVRARDYVRFGSMTSGIRSARSRCARPRCRPSRRGWATPTFRRPCATSTTAIAGTRRSCWRRRSR